MYTNIFLYGIKSKNSLLRSLGLFDFVDPKDAITFINNIHDIKWLDKKTGEYLDVKNDNSRQICLLNRNIKGANQYYSAMKRVHNAFSSSKEIKNSMPYIQSTFKGTSNYKNASIHKKSSNLLVTDIRDFFGSTLFVNVKKFFEEKLNMSNDCAALMASLVCIKNDGKYALGQGMVTSPIFAAIVNNDMFEKLNSLGRDRDLIMSVYVDDVTFSSKTFIDNSFLEVLNQTFIEFGFRPSWKKTSIKRVSMHKKQIVTGIAIFSDKVFPWMKPDKWMNKNYLKKMDSIIDKLNKYSIVMLNEKIMTTILSKTKRGGNLFQVYTGHFTYYNSAMDVINKEFKGRVFRGWIKDKKYYTDIYNQIIKCARLFGKPMSSITESDYLHIRKTLNAIKSIKKK